MLTKSFLLKNHVIHVECDRLQTQGGSTHRVVRPWLLTGPVGPCGMLIHSVAPVSQCGVLVSC